MTSTAYTNLLKVLQHHNWISLSTPDFYREEQTPGQGVCRGKGKQQK